MDSATLKVDKDMPGKKDLQFLCTLEAEKDLSIPHW